MKYLFPFEFSLTVQQQTVVFVCNREVTVPKNCSVLQFAFLCDNYEASSWIFSQTAHTKRYSQLKQTDVLEQICLTGDPRYLQIIEDNLGYFTHSGFQSRSVQRLILFALSQIQNEEHG